ncbi:hypothetical protein MTO96_043410 [Rhipicephalus appendiculatus]
MPLSNFPFRHHGVRRTHHTRLDQPIDAVVYVSVVFVLFAAIILLLVATNLAVAFSLAVYPARQRSHQKTAANPGAR